MGLLLLPDELILCCISSLPISDIALILTGVGNRHLARLISSSPTMQYRIEQFVAGVRENAAAFDPTSSIAERRNRLRAREDRWLGFAPLYRVQIRLPMLKTQSKGYIVSADSFTFVHSVDRTTALGAKVERLALGEEEPRWRKLNLPTSL